jgi:2-oxoglutarate dehydrogenase E2 component (dihydrolipoamide succinyltransferase)
MSSHKVTVPALGESISEATLVRWFKSDGEKVSIDEPLCDLETDKATVALPAPVAGVLKRVAAEGATVQIGELVANIDDAATATTEAPAKAKPPTAPAMREVTPMAPRETVEVRAPQPRMPEVAGATPAPRPIKDPEGVRREPMTKLRLKIAQRLLAAKQDTAMLTTFNEVDMTAVQELRARLKEDFEKTYGVPLGLMSFFARATILALKEFPIVNASIDGADVLYHDWVNLGVAVSTERGLVVPVLQRAEKMSFGKIESEIRRMAVSARDGKLELSELGGGTFTITNGGIFGSLMSTPILNPPQAAILGMHAIQKRAKVLSDDKIAVRPMMYLALSYDHRLIDGKDSVRFLVRVKEWVEDPEKMLLEL